MSNKNTFRFTPLVIAVSVVLGILIGTFYAKHYGGNKLGIINASSNKLNALLHVIENQYVDTVDMTELVENTMPQILAELDPHSTYIPAKDLQEVNSELEGSFSGVGIQFTILQDTIHVNSIVPGGPAEKVGMLAGDRIVTVDDSLFVGKDLTNERALRTLKGPKGSEVRLGVKRATEKELLHFTIVRGDIPQNTIDAAYMLSDDYGYIQVSKFGRTTHVELLSTIAQLTHKGCKGLIIDLRDNTGGYMDASTRMVNEFLPANKLIVYAEGRKYPRWEDYADGTGSCQQMPLVVLINEGSASASEIFAGAIQDNDRGTIIGRRSFGKGLVQQPIDFSDGSGIRLTIARYYTPSGRCIPVLHQPGTSRLRRRRHHAGHLRAAGHHGRLVLAHRGEQQGHHPAIQLRIHGQEPRQAGRIHHAGRSARLPGEAEPGATVCALCRQERRETPQPADTEVAQAAATQPLRLHHLQHAGPRGIHPLHQPGRCHGAKSPGGTEERRSLPPGTRTPNGGKRC